MQFIAHLQQTQQQTNMTTIHHRRVQETSSTNDGVAGLFQLLIFQYLIQSELAETVQTLISQTRNKPLLRNIKSHPRNHAARPESFGKKSWGLWPGRKAVCFGANPVQPNNTQVANVKHRKILEHKCSISSRTISKNTAKTEETSWETKEGQNWGMSQTQTRSEPNGAMSRKLFPSDGVELE